RQGLPLHPARIRGASGQGLREGRGGLRGSRRRRRRGAGGGVPDQRAYPAPPAFPALGRQGLRRASRAREDQGQDDHRSHLPGGDVAPRARAPRQDQRQHVPGREQRVHGRGGQGHQSRHGRESAELLDDGTGAQGQGAIVGGGGGRELQRGVGQ